MDSLQTNITIVSKALCVDSQKLWRWYRDSLSGFLDCTTQQKHYQHDVTINTGKGQEIVRVPILKAENIGVNMAIDEKLIGEEMHTVLSNRDTGKIAMLAESVNSFELQKAIIGIGDKADLVQTITRDLSATYARFCTDTFQSASQIADKFHIIKSLMDASQDVRVRYRQDALREKRLAYEQFKKQQKDKKQQCLEQGIPYQKENFKLKEEKLTNGETLLEALARSRYLLFKFKSDWTKKQEKRAVALFEKYPEIEKAYTLSCIFRNWMKKENVGKNMSVIKSMLNDWFNAVNEAEIDELLNFKSMIQRNLLEILNYFRFGATNAIAENINGKIKRFITINQGTRDREFFYFRIANYFS